MKKIVIYCVLCIISITAVYGIPSYYGLHGLNFIPSARTGDPGSLGVGVASVPNQASELNIYPYSVRGYYTFTKYLEIGLSNTYLYYRSQDDPFWDIFPQDNPEVAYQANIANTIVPVVPSIKFAFVDEAVPNGSLAVGFEYPYGVFLLFDYYLSLPAEFSLYSVVGLSTTVSALYGMGGVVLGTPLDLSLVIEGAYGGLTNMLTTPQEVFISAGLLYAITDTVSFNYVFRLDNDMIRRMIFGFNVEL